jgi:polysaccharide export outer membrane protein
MGMNWFKSLLLVVIGVFAISYSSALAEDKTPSKAERVAVDAPGEIPSASSQPLPGQSTPIPQTDPNLADGHGSAKTHATVSSGVPYDYKIGAGDVLDISVWREPEASIHAVIVRPDGKISLPLLKDVQVAGLTPTDVENMITERLVKWIQEPDVTVIVSGTQSQRIYAIGAVKREGPIPFTYQMSVMQAISEAGGLSVWAKRKKIYVLRNENGKQVKLPFDYDGMFKGEHTELNIQLLPGDTLVVP